MKKENLTISPETHAFVECMHTLNNHWQQTMDALRKTYTEETSCELIKNEYNPAFEQLKSVLQKFLLQSIEHNMGVIGFNEI
ncbi:hypothetical protein D0T50_03515 [Bacteroides sp. 214]|uniref:hypothetical protein n=1 Tax=Bacteroides sp. 214 TaxID=2302935 RepID=UPI0013D5E3BC|nr:hypothetical protein [Bacteroides sp. 214]NDW11957.1 hypothetical protein [Bacteroides sp. 214]